MFKAHHKHQFFVACNSIRVIECHFFPTVFREATHIHRLVANHFAILVNHHTHVCHVAILEIGDGVNFFASHCSKFRWQEFAGSINHACALWIVPQTVHTVVGLVVVPFQLNVRRGRIPLHSHLIEDGARLHTVRLPTLRPGIHAHHHR